ncbi:hypothetical protein Tco_0383047 [Tanacetum coccineum]
MDPMISLGQKNTLAEYMILSGADNRPPMLDKDLFDSWKSRMELYMQNREHGRMILESKIQADCDMKATNIILKGLPADIYSLKADNDRTSTKSNGRAFQVNTKFLNSLPPEWIESFAVLVFSPRDDPIACLNKAMAFLTTVASLREDKGKIILVILIRAMLLVQGKILQVDRQELLNATTAKVKDICITPPNLLASELTIWVLSNSTIVTRCKE